MGRNFAVVPVPVRDTVLGGLTADVPGSHIDAVARLEPGDGEPRYHVDFLATGVDASRVAEARRRLRRVFTVLLDLETGRDRWHARGRVPLSSITSRALRVLGAGGEGLAEPWVDIEGGIACVHLRPRGRDADDAFCDQVAARMKACGLELPVRLEEADETAHDHHRRCLEGSDDAGETAVRVA